LQVGLFFAQTVRRLASRGAVQTLVSHFRLPAPDFGIGRDDVEAPAGPLHSDDISIQGARFGLCFGNSFTIIKLCI
jgi:hypothetical protein